MSSIEGVIRENCYLKKSILKAQLEKSHTDKE